MVLNGCPFLFVSACVNTSLPIGNVAYGCSHSFAGDGDDDGNDEGGNSGEMVSCFHSPAILGKGFSSGCQNTRAFSTSKQKLTINLKSLDCRTLAFRAKRGRERRMRERRAITIIYPPPKTGWSEERASSPAA